MSNPDCEADDISALIEQHDASLNVFLLSGSNGTRKQRAITYMCDKLAHPDPGSDFDRSFGSIKGVFEESNPRRYIHTGWFLNAVKLLYGMDAMMLEPKDGRPEEEMKIFGYNGFSIKGNRFYGKRSMHVFSTEVIPELRGQKLGAYLNALTMRYALDIGITDYRIGKGTNELAEGIIDTLVRHQRDYDLHVERNGEGWIEIGQLARIGNSLLHKLI